MIIIARVSIGGGIKNHQNIGGGGGRDKKKKRRKKRNIENKKKINKTLKTQIQSALQYHNTK